MHQIHLYEILRDVDIASAIAPTVRERHLAFADVRDALTTLNVPRPADVASLVSVR
jgi:hypothetical protein